MADAGPAEGPSCDGVDMQQSSDSAWPTSRPGALGGLHAERERERERETGAGRLGRRRARRERQSVEEDISWVSVCSGRPHHIAPAEVPESTNRARDSSSAYRQWLAAAAAAAATGPCACSRGGTDGMCLHPVVDVYVRQRTGASGGLPGSGRSHRKIKPAQPLQAATRWRLARERGRVGRGG